MNGKERKTKYTQRKQWKIETKNKNESNRNKSIYNIKETN
jgi:hypothetical protein